MTTKIDSRGETQRSIERRGLIGHYITGFYRVLARPLAMAVLTLRARWRYFIWGMEEVSLLIKLQPQRYVAPLMRKFGAMIAEDAYIGEGIWIIGVNRDLYRPLKIGRKAFFGRNILIDLASDVEFGDYSAIGNETRYFCHTDLAHSPLTDKLYPVAIGSVKIGRGAFIGPGSTIGNGVIIGENSVVGAHSVVLKHVPPHTLVAGSPARVIKRINPDSLGAFPNETPILIPEGSTLDDFPYDDSMALKIPENAGTLG